MLEKEGMKNTIFLDGFTPAPPDVSKLLTNPAVQASVETTLQTMEAAARLAFREVIN
jgi:hypothetical protein